MTILTMISSKVYNNVILEIKMSWLKINVQDIYPEHHWTQQERCLCVNYKLFSKWL